MFKAELRPQSGTQCSGPKAVRHSRYANAYAADLHRNHLCHIGHDAVLIALPAQKQVGDNAVDVSPWRRNHLREATWHDQRAGAVAVIHEQALSAAAGDSCCFQCAQMTSHEGRPS